MKNVIAIASAVFLLGACTTTSGSSSARFVHYGQMGGAQSVGMHTVVAGDSVYNIAQRYNLALQDVISANNLQAPYALKNGTRLRLTPPQTYKAKEGDTAESVARMFSVSASQLTRMNNLHAPYKLSAGQSLRLPPAIRPAPPLMTSEMMARYAKSSGTATSGSGRMNSGAATDDPSDMPEVASARPAAVEREVLSSPAPVAAEPLSPPMATVGTPVPAPSQKAVSVASTTVPPRAGSKFIWPADGPVISTYGPKSDGRHNDGINIKARQGAPVRAAENGVVVYSGNELQGYGNLVLIRHADRWLTAYGHMDSVVVTKGMTINRGQTIGTVGQTGSVDAPQLHFEVRRGTDALNPEPYLAQQGS